MSPRSMTLSSTLILLALGIACGSQDSSISSPTVPSNVVAGGTAADGSTLKATAPAPISPINDAAVNDSPTLIASTSLLKFGQGVLQYRFEVLNASGAKVQDSGLVASPAFKVTATLDFKKRYTWRVRAEYQAAVGPWSTTASFISPDGGYIRGNEVFDPLFNGQSVGDLVGNVGFVPDKGVKLNDGSGYVRYLIPQTITAGEFSAEVEGLRADAPGNKSKVFGMQEGQGDFITNPYRVDIQYRGASGSPSNSITFRALYGSATDLSVRYEPDTATRYNSVYNLNPSTTYYWRTTWGNGEFRVMVREGGATGAIIYNQAVPTRHGTYNPQPHYAYLGAPVGRSGDESVSIPGAIYRNVWISTRPRP